MVYLWTMHGLQSRVDYQQHRPSVNYINRVGIQQRLLVEFSCDFHIDSLLRAFVKIVDGRLRLFLFSLFHFIFLCLLISIFYFQNNLDQGLSVTLSHQSQFDGIVTRLITRLRRREQKVLEQSDVIQYGQHMLASCFTHGRLGQDAQ